MEGFSLPLVRSRRGGVYPRMSAYAFTRIILAYFSGEDPAKSGISLRSTNFAPTRLFCPPLHFMLKIPPQAGERGLGGEVYCRQVKKLLLLVAEVRKINWGDLGVE